MQSAETQKPNTYASALKDVVATAKDFMHSEVGLIKAELAESADRIARHSVQGALFGALLALSVIPFMAFMVLGLAELLDGRYWLSALIVAVFFGAIGGYMTWHAYQSLKNEDFTLPRARRGLEKQMETVQEKVQDLKETVLTGETHGGTQFARPQQQQQFAFGGAGGTSGQ